MRRDLIIPGYAQMSRGEAMAARKRERLRPLAMEAVMMAAQPRQTALIETAIDLLYGAWSCQEVAGMLRKGYHMNEVISTYVRKLAEGIRAGTPPSEMGSTGIRYVVEAWRHDETREDAQLIKTTFPAYFA